MLAAGHPQTSSTSSTQVMHRPSVCHVTNFKPLLVHPCTGLAAGNPDWQSQSLKSVDTMYDAVEYAVGWMEFWLHRAEDAGAPSNCQAGYLGMEAIGA
jgi:hypothetical protein